ncbi:MULTISPECIES: carboxymuconolactone decarboxylase family protein [Actinokineospora]|uniref:Alkyl hydroperoxide reductase AhpD n=1 Tax=Actinokineospora fastidiosa TaxID=1816 RepID=A0A918GES4_9PSEU|nr:MULTISPECIES: carboxymuconolactone decarboxylase family protein [Actinokineospora]UVS79988.1 alkylhydroperoxidase AhpD family core domain protein [Actinokineospora sp. UTMC 2448]GGS32303.1 alkyl hydroperoxide reductase AhpD [Actinokineospora fastidiosa]
MGTFIRLALRRTLNQIRHVARVRPGRGGDLVVGVHRQVETDFGLLAPIALHTSAPAALAASWLMLRESLVAAGLVARSTKEAVAVGVSDRNRCPYCVEVHSATLAALTDVRSELDPVAEWARTGGGETAPFTCDEAPEHIGTAVAFHYLNRMASVFLTDSPLPPGLPDGARQVLGRAMRPHAGQAHRPGRALEFLPAAEPAADLGWAASNPVLSDAFARAYQAIDSLAVRMVPADVRAVVTDALDAWDGTPVGLSRAWAYDQAAALPHESFAAGVLALLTAKAPYQVDDTIVNDFRRGRPDAELVALTAWAALAAARRLGPGRARVPHAGNAECACSAHQPL